MGGSWPRVNSTSTTTPTTWTTRPLLVLVLSFVVVAIIVLLVVLVVLCLSCSRGKVVMYLADQGGWRYRLSGPGSACGPYRPKCRDPDRAVRIITARRAAWLLRPQPCPHLHRGLRPVRP